MLGPQIAQADFRVIAPFLRGYPPSDLPAADTDSRTLGEDVLALAPAFGGDVRVIGHDWGAEAVFAAAALATGQIRRMVTVAVPARAAIRLTPQLFWALRHFITLTLPGAEARFARDDFREAEVLCRRWSPTWELTATDLVPVKQAFRIPGALHAALGYYRAASFRTPAFLRAPIGLPTLSFAGADDPALSLSVYEAARSHFRAGYEVASIPGGHFCHRESPQAFLAAVIPFLKR